MNLPTRKEAVQYLYNQALAQFTAFYIGIYSTGIVSRFFETKSITNLWGFLAQKTVVDAGTFSILERIVAVVIGFIVFEIVNRNLKPLLERFKPVVDQEIGQFVKERSWNAKWETLKVTLNTKRVAFLASMKEQGWDAKWETLKVNLNTKRVAFLASMNAAIRNAIKKRFSK